MPKTITYTQQPTQTTHKQVIMPQITLMTEAVLIGRIGTILNCMTHKDFDKAKSLLNDTVKLFHTVAEKDIDRALEKYASRNMYYALLEMSMKRYVTAHGYLASTQTALYLPNTL